MLPESGLGLHWWLARAALRAEPGRALCTGLLLAVAATCFGYAPYTVHPPRRGTNESSAIGSLRSLATAQAQFHSDRRVDQDGNGVGEFGWLGELAGTEAVRGGGPQLNASPYIAAILGTRDSLGIAQKAGYCFAMFLRDPDGEWQPEPVGPSGTEPPDTDPDAAEAQEREWICYAWPQVRGQTGNRAFMADQRGEVWQTPNTAASQCYSGPNHGPSPDAAVPIGPPAAGAWHFTGTDGGAWAPAGN